MRKSTKHSSVELMITGGWIKLGDKNVLKNEMVYNERLVGHQTLVGGNLLMSVELMITG